jgi:acyl-coenzyme A synthetase/AMP-(fatty) acid ligase
MTSAIRPLEEMARAALTRDPGQRVLEFQDKVYDWGFFQGAAGAVMRLLDEAGVDPRDPIGFVPRNTAASVAAFIGMIAGARTIRMIYAFQRPVGIARDVGRLKLTGVVITARDATEEVIAVAREQGVAMVVIDDVDGPRYAPGCERSTAAPDPVRPEKPELQILTSGTTGPPKHFGLPYTVVARTITQNPLYAVPPEKAADIPPASIVFPFGNISGVYSVLPPVLSGQFALLREKFDLNFWRDYVVRYRPTRIGLPPSAVRVALDADIPAEDLASLDSLLSGSAPLDPTVHREFEAKYGIPILLSYGATEFGGPVAMMTAELHKAYGEAKFGSNGRAFDGAELRVIDADTGEILPPGTEGLLEVMSPRMGTHWIRTTDIVVIDEDGFLFHRGRADGAIMRGGFKILPETIAKALMTHPAVAAVSVVGVANRRLGQTPGAALQLVPGAEPPSFAELEAHLRDRVLATHIPTHWKIVKALPSTPSFKIDQAAVRALFAEDGGGAG